MHKDMGRESLVQLSKFRKVSINIEICNFFAADDKYGKDGVYLVAIDNNINQFAPNVSTTMIS